MKEIFFKNMLIKNVFALKELLIYILKISQIIITMCSESANSVKAQQCHCLVTIIRS